MAKEYRHIGKATPRKDARDIVTGRAQYIDDIKIPKMLHAKVLGSPYPHAKIKSIDTYRAEAYPGVQAVLTYKNVPNWKFGIPHHRLVLDRTVRFVGDGVALVAAETEETAEEALELIDVEYQVLPAVYDVEEAIKPGTPQLYDEFPRNTLPRGYRGLGPNGLQEIVMGDVEKGFEEADFVVEGTCRYDKSPNPLPPEPPGVITMWEDENRVTVWTAAQSAAQNRFYAQPAMDLADVRVIGTQCGGSYGTKNSNLILLTQAAALSKVTGRPVKLYYSKEEHFNIYSLRLGSRIHGKIGIKKDGTVTAVSGDWYVDTGASSETMPVQIGVGCGEVQLMLRCSNWNLQPSTVCTNRTPSGVVRGFGGQELKSALTPILTIAMEKIGIDPLEFFKKNYIKPGDKFTWRDGIWYTCRSVDYTKAMQKGAEVFGWRNKWKGWGIPTLVEGTKRRGVGVGIHGNADVGEDESEAWVKLNPDSRVVIYSCVSESGMGERSALCKMVAELLDLPLDNVSITPPDTLVNPFEFGLVGSRGTYTVGSAVLEAAANARQKLFELAAPLLDEKPEDMYTGDGVIYVTGKPEKQIPWYRVMGVMRTITGEGRFEPDFSVPNFMMIFTEVEVDIETGKTELIYVVATTDCGQIIDPLVLEGQIHGSLGAAGTDTALLEETVLDTNSGHILNCNMIDFKWRTYLDLPEFKCVILETPIPTHHFKAIGIGEIATSPGPSAVNMAIYNAIGKRILEYPVTPDKILRVLGRS
jgi:CO/xanthine dehydrogenase Mo-binding subunit